MSQNTQIGDHENGGKSENTQVRDSYGPRNFDNFLTDFLGFLNDLNKSENTKKKTDDKPVT